MGPDTVSLNNSISYDLSLHNAITYELRYYLYILANVMRLNILHFSIFCVAISIHSSYQIFFQLLTIYNALGGGCLIAKGGGQCSPVLIERFY